MGSILHRKCTVWICISSTAVNLPHYKIVKVTVTPKDICQYLNRHKSQSRIIAPNIRRPAEQRRRYELWACDKEDQAR